MHNCSKLFCEAVERHPRPYAAGLDISLTSPGFYLKSIWHEDEDDEFFYSLETTSKSGTDADRIEFIVETILTDLTNPLYPVIAVCIEDYGQINPRAGKLMQRAEICGSIKRGLRLAGIPYYTVSPNGLKKFATGHGGTRKGEKLKEAVMLAASSVGFHTKISDQADAFWLARLASSIVKNEHHGIDVSRVNPVGFSFDKKH